MNDTMIEKIHKFELLASTGKFDELKAMIAEGFDITISNAYYFAAESGQLHILKLLDLYDTYRFSNDAIFAAESNRA
jgi:hypothetical protein